MPLITAINPRFTRHHQNVGWCIFMAYPRTLCSHCWSDRPSWHDARGAGTLKSFLVVHRPGHPSWPPAVPYIVGLVALAEGPTMLSLILLPAPEAAVVGMALRVRFVKGGKTILPLFEANAAAAPGQAAPFITERTDV
jgi:uncharacterized protein